MSELSTTTIHSTHRLTNLFWVVSLAFLTLLAFYPERATAAKELRKVAVAEPYVELHTGPGRGYPVFYIAERGETVELLKQRTDWIKLRTARGVEGWAHNSWRSSRGCSAIAGGGSVPSSTIPRSRRANRNE